MRLLLDTHTLLWLAMTPDRLPEAVRDQVRTAESRTISAASGMEIATKVRIGKLDLGRQLLDGWQRLMADLRSTEMSLSVAHMVRAGGLEWSHRDPFDRMLVAQAMLEGLVVVTRDSRIVDYDGVQTLSW